MSSPPVITSKSNERVKALRAAFAGRASRPGERVGIEGEHLIAEALRSGLALETVFVRQGDEAMLSRPWLRDAYAGDFVVLSEAAFASAVETETPQGVAATLAIPAERGLPEGAGLVLVLESVRDPGNVGTLLRSAEAFGADAVVLTGECAHVWNAKVMRASAGSVFRVPVLRVAEQDVRAVLAGMKLVAAVAPHDAAVSLLVCDLREACAVMIGNEGAGLSDALRAMADASVTIPCRTESLNAAVAGSTFLYEAMRQRAGSGPALGGPGMKVEGR